MRDVVIIALGALAGAASFVVASAVLDFALVLEGGEPGIRSWRERFSWLTPHYAVYGFVAAGWGSSGGCEFGIDQERQRGEK